MRLYFPISILCFVAVGITFLFQLFPIISIISLFLIGLGWSEILINLGMIGIAFEALTTRKLRYWLFLPVVFYAGYWVLALWESQKFKTLTDAYDTANMQTKVEFDPVRDALVFETQNTAAWASQNYKIPIVYYVSKNLPNGFGSYRLVGKEVFDQEQYDWNTLNSEDIKLWSIFDDTPSKTRRPNDRAKLLSMPEKPSLPIVLVSSSKKKTITESTLPVVTRTTFIKLPNLQRHEILSGTAARLPWIPKPVVG